MEDNYQYIVGKKVDCNVFITENTKDFKYFTDILVVNPKKYSVL